MPPTEQGGIIAAMREPSGKPARDFLDANCQFELEMIRLLSPNDDRWRWDFDFHRFVDGAHAGNSIIIADIERLLEDSEFNRSNRNRFEKLKRLCIEKLDICHQWCPWEESKRSLKAYYLGHAFLMECMESALSVSVQVQDRIIESFLVPKDDDLADSQYTCSSEQPSLRN